MRSLLALLLVLCLASTSFGKKYDKQILASLPPLNPPSQSATVSPQVRNDYLSISVVSDSNAVPVKFSTFGTSFFQYFGLSSLVDEPVVGNDDDYIFEDDDDGANDDGADDDDQVVFNDVGDATMIVFSCSVFIISFIAMI